MQANNTLRVLGYSIVKIKRVSEWYLFYCNYHYIEQQKVHFLITLSIKSKPQFEKLPVIVNPIKCKQKIHGGLLFIPKSKSRGWVIYIDFLIILVILNNKRYILWYSIFKYDHNLIFDMFFSSLIYDIYSRKFRISDILSFLLKSFEAVEGYHKVQFPILIYNNIGKYRITNVF